MGWILLFLLLVADQMICYLVMDSRDYLINETIQVRWDPYATPYVGSMDKNYSEQIAALFKDVLVDTSVSFILKNQDLNWDGYNEISLYSTRLYGIERSDRHL